MIFCHQIWPRWSTNSKVGQKSEKKNSPLYRQEVFEIHLARFFDLVFAEPVLQNTLFCQVVEGENDFAVGLGPPILRERKIINLV